MQELILTAKEFIDLKDVGAKLKKDGSITNEDKLNQILLQAQSIDLYDILNDFYFDLIQNIENQQYQDLINGSFFDVRNKRYYQKGLKSVVSDFAYSRYMHTINTNITPFGAVTKSHEDSNPVSYKTLQEISKQTQLDVEISFRMIDKYLNANKSLFPRYSKGNNEAINTNNFNITFF